MKSPNATKESSTKSRIYLNLYHFATGDIKNNSGLEVEFMIDPGSTCTIINHPTYLALVNLGQNLHLQNTNCDSKTYTGSSIRMLGYTTIQSSFETDGKYTVPHKVFVTKEQRQNIIGIDFCHLFLKALHFDIPAVELKTERNLICYGSLNNEKDYPYITEMTALNIAQPIFLQQKSTQLHKQKHPSQALFPPGTYFMPHINVAKTDLVFVNTLCPQHEEFLPIFLENQKNHPIQINRGIIGYAMCDITDKPIQRYNIKNCAEFTSTILNESEDYNSCFILNTVVNNLQEGQQVQTNSCIRYVDFRTQSIFDSNMPIAHTISSDAEMRKGFANTISKRIPLLKDYCKKKM